MKKLIAIILALFTLTAFCSAAALADIGLPEDASLSESQIESVKNNQELLDDLTVLLQKDIDTLDDDEVKDFIDKHSDDIGTFVAEYGETFITDYGEEFIEDYGRDLIKDFIGKLDHDTVEELLSKVGISLPVIVWSTVGFAIFVLLLFIAVIVLTVLLVLKSKKLKKLEAQQSTLTKA